MTFAQQFLEPPKEYTLVPFWFWNDALDDTEIRRQIDDFADHGVHGFIPHARIGLPDDIGFVSERWLHFIRVAVEHAARKGMQVILYDEGMYPSGSCAGKVVAANLRHAARCLERREPGDLADNEELVAEIDGWAYVHTRSGGTIRGVHFGTDDGQPGAPPAGDILNPEAVASFLHLALDPHYDAVKQHFGKTVRAVFTDEPSMLGRGAKRGVRPWTWGLAEYLQQRLGEDFRPHLPALWDDAAPDAAKWRAWFEEALDERLREAYYAPYSAWCAAHGVALTGHPAGPMDMGTLQHFHIPGQDIVWRYIEPFQEKSLEGPQSTMAKCSASAQVNHGRKRNANECFGAYGWEFTYDEMRWITHWLLVRGVNLLMPHAFYYSVRGERRNERPPDVGPNNTWWDGYATYANACRRLCWMLAEGRQVCSVAVLGTPTQLPWDAARICYEHQWDLNYVDTDTLLNRAEAEATGLRVAEMRYEAVIIDGGVGATPEALAALTPLIESGRVLAHGVAVPGLKATTSPTELTAALDAAAVKDVRLDAPAPGLRYHHVRHRDSDCYLFTNEGETAVDAGIKVFAAGQAQWWDPDTGHPTKADPARVLLPPYGAAVLRVSSGQA